MNALLWICAAAASLLPLANARAEGGGLATDASRVPWARFQARVSAAPGAPGWRAELAPIERSGLQVGGLGLLGDVYFNAATVNAAVSPASGFRATSGVLVGSRSPFLSNGSTTGSNGLFPSDRRLFGASTAAPTSLSDSTLDSATVPYLGIGYSNLWGKSGWSFSADLGVVSQSPGSVVRFGRVFGGGQNLDDLVRDMRLAPVIQLGVGYSF